ncbi:MAG TPA: FCD domain-containing protein [Anaerolineaceae bacterium]|nr:FCD domain-containing protein [Anaerolineaceae bacterium]
MSEFLSYLAANDREDDRIPPLAELSQKLGVSIAILREQMEVARALGLVEVKPKTGIRRLPYTFKPAVKQSLTYAISTDQAYFSLYADLRKHIEQVYWIEAVPLLTPKDHDLLRSFIQRAKDKLNAVPAQIPHTEHREFHLAFYRRLNNPFVLGLLETYWELYEEVGLNVFTDYNYLQKVWKYHEVIVDAICNGDLLAGSQALSDHMDLLQQRPKTSTNQKFE